MDSVTPNQQMMISHQLMSSKSVKYNLGAFVALSESIDSKRFEAAIKYTVDRHGILKKKIVFENNEFKFSAARSLQYIEYIDFTDSGSTFQSIKEHFYSEMQCPFQILDSILYKSVLIKLADEEYYWFVKIHHVIADGWSFVVLFNSVLNFYFGGHSPVDVNMVNSPHLEEDLEKLRRDKMYWSKAIENIGSSIFYEIARNTTIFQKPFFQMSTVNYSFPAKIINTNLSDHAANYSLSQVILSVIVIYFSKLLTKDDICINIPIHNRNSKNRNEVGLFMNNLPLFFNEVKARSVIDIVKLVKRKLYEMLRFSTYPSSKIFEDNNISDLKVSNFRDILFSYEEVDYFGVDGIPKPEAIHSGHDDVFVSFHFRYFKNLNKITVDVDYCASVFKEQDVNSFMCFLQDFFVNFRKKISSTVSELKLLGDSHTLELIRKSRSKAADISNLDFFTNILHNMSEFSDKVAIYSKDKILTYNDLRYYVSLIGDFLKSNNFKENSIVPFVSSNSWLTPAFLIACLQYKFCYVPIDINTPVKRILIILDELGVDFFITDFTPCKELIVPGGVVDLNDVVNGRTFSFNIHSNVVLPTPTAYIIFTSGSTGVPKGVMIGLESFVSFFSNLMAILPSSSALSSISLTRFSFDISLVELLLPIVTGGKVLIPEVVMGERNWEDIITQINNEKPNFIQATPTMWRLLLGSDLKISRKTIVFVGGESFNEDLKGSLLNISDNVFNMYGPTEATVWVTSSRLKSADLINLGAAFGGNFCIVADRNGNMLPDNCVGELIIGGDQLATGYWKRELETEKKFFSMIIGDVSLGKFYKTGDRVMAKDGELIFLGRFDEQVKVNGYRIELRDLEATVNQLVDIRQCKAICVVNNDKSSIVLFFESEVLNEGQILTHLTNMLPNYMLPYKIFRLSEFPLTINGKIDKNRLEILFKQYDRDGNNRNSLYMSSGLLHFCREILGNPKLKKSDNLFENGLNSMKAAYIRQFLQEKFGETIDFKKIYSLLTIERIEKEIDNLENEGYENLEI